MHEMSIAIELLSLVEQRLPPHASLQAAQVRIGPMHGVVAEAMQWAWRTVVAERGWPRARLLIDTPPWRLQCPACGRQWRPQAMDERCTCGHLEATLIGGDEFLLLSIEVLLPDANTPPAAGNFKHRCVMNVTVPVIENVLKVNDEIALLNRRVFNEAGVLVVDLIGAPGAGKTALLELTLQQLAGTSRVGVVVGDPATARDGQRLARFTDNVVQINTGHGCHLDANQVRQAIAKLPLEQLDILVIENVGNLICPVGFDLGQHAKVGLFSVSEGDDKAAKHPHLVLTADVLILNKIDLLPYVPFDLPRFREDVRHLNQMAPLLEVSVALQQIDSWIRWLIERSAISPHKD